MKAKAQPESIIQTHVYAYLCTQPEYFGFSVRNGGVYDPRIGTYRANGGPGYRRGVSDLIGSWNGQLLAIEIKTPKGRLSPEQKQFQKDVIKAGGLAMTIRSVSEIVAFVTSLRIAAAEPDGSFTH